jgi:S1-C subfamily serine protease
MQSTTDIPRRKRSPVRLCLGALALVLLVVVAAGAGSARAGAAGPRTGVVVVEATLGYAGGQAAGSGMVLAPGGKILTNNHVIEGATAIRVVVPATGRHYVARVAGYSVANDVAVLRLRDASRLATVSTATGTNLRLGQSVTATGNARGTGALTTVHGAITGLSKSITAGDGQGDSERLTGLIETNAPVVSGDSGGPLQDENGRVIGMVTAAGGLAGVRIRDVAQSTAYAIPIGTALAIVRTIDAGRSTALVHVGPTAFLGISVASAQGTGTGSRGAVVAGVATGGPAARAGLERGDVIVRVDGKAVGSPRILRARVLAKHPGQTMRIVYTDALGTRRTVVATLASGPPQ